MSITFQVTNINQNMHIPAHIIAEEVASLKFADEFAKITAKEKQDKVDKIKKVEETHKIDTNSNKKDREKMYHIDIKG